MLHGLVKQTVTVGVSINFGELRMLVSPASRGKTGLNLYLRFTPSLYWVQFGGLEDQLFFPSAASDIAEGDHDDARYINLAFGNEADADKWLEQQGASDMKKGFSSRVCVPPSCYGKTRRRINKG